MAKKEIDQKMIDDICRRLDKPLVLVGLMGVGKTRLGRAVARTLGFKFVDSDHEIEKAAGMEVSDIFSRFGEDYFRDGEHRVIRRIMGAGVQVIATGGGAPMHPETASLLWRESITVWLRADLDVMVERTSRNDKRPLLNTGDPRKILQGMIEKRYPVYEKADILIESYDAPVYKIVKNLLEKLDRHLRQRND